MVFHKHKVGLITVSLVYCIIAFKAYTLVNHVIEYGNHKSTGRTFQALFAYFLVAMVVVSHLRAMLSNPGYVKIPKTKIDFSSDLEKGPDGKPKKKKLPAIDEWTVCTHCETFRPPRAHHCRKCGRCVRRMDHHCPWTNNCIGELNFKYFYLFLVYAGTFCMYSLILIINDWRFGEYTDTTDKVMTIILFNLNIIFGMFIYAVGTGVTIAVLCDRNALEVRRYGHPMKFPKTPFVMLVAALCGRGSKFLWLIPCVAPRIPEPIPPSKYTSMYPGESNHSIHNV